MALLAYLLEQQSTKRQMKMKLIERLLRWLDGENLASNPQVNFSPFGYFSF